MKCGAIAPDERRNAAQTEKIVQAFETYRKNLIPATDLDALNALDSACGASTTARNPPVQIANFSGQSDSDFKKTALAYFTSTVTSLMP